MRPHRSARLMGYRPDLAHLNGAGAGAKARRLGRGRGADRETVKGRRHLFSCWEDMLTMIAGPRTHETTAYAVPALLAAQGGCLATSNKRDIVDATGRLRGELGGIWVFDPHVANTPQTWWWTRSATSPLRSPVRRGPRRSSPASSSPPPGRPAPALTPNRRRGGEPGRAAAGRCAR